MMAAGAHIGVVANGSVARLFPGWRYPFWVGLRRLVTVVVMVACGTSSPPQVERDRSSRSALFVCHGDFLETHRCFPSKAAELTTWDLKDRTLSERAWCFEAPARVDSRFCFLSLDDCTRRARLDPFSDGPCREEDATTELAARATTRSD